jgi:hypothetical protein
MSCSEVCIDMGLDWCDRILLFCQVARIAKRRHLCCECKGAIEVETQYEYSSGKGEYCGFFSAKTCSTCAEIRKAMVCGDYYFGRLWESITENVFPAWITTGPWECLAKIDSAEARAELQRRFAEWRAMEER